MSRFRCLLPLLVLLALSACNPLAPGACTLIGCEDGLTIELDYSLTEPYRLEIVPSGTREVRVIACPNPAACSRTVFIAGFTPESVTIRLIRGTDVREVTSRPEYRVTRPNGRRCPPRCNQATVRFPLPAP